MTDRDEAAQILQEMLAELQHIKKDQAAMLRLMHENRWPQLSEFPGWLQAALSVWLALVVGLLPILALLKLTGWVN
jgi:hypothetical protein